LLLFPLQNHNKKGNGMGRLAWYEMAVLWGFAVLVIILDRKNWDKLTDLPAMSAVAVR
jgi:hypothetical protein